jgi:hypothetical protein
VFHQTNPDNYELVEKVSTAKGARTSLYVPQWHRLFLAIPDSEGGQPQIRVYEAGDSGAGTETKEGAKRRGDNPPSKLELPAIVPAVAGAAIQRQ